MSSLSAPTFFNQSNVVISPFDDEEKGSGMKPFKALLAEAVSQNTLNESNWNSESWKNTWASVNQDVLNDAFSQHGLVQSIFSDIGEMTQRNCKSVSRVEKKMLEQTKGRENYFKVVSDFVAIRLHCDVSEIQKKIDCVREIVIAHGGQIHVRGFSNERFYGFFMNADKVYADITQYVYVFMEKVGYPIEIQIGHKFASHTFTIDSALRENKECGKVDLWNKNFYSDVKKYILDKANGENPGPKDGILIKAEDLHQNKVPQELKEILNNLDT